MTAMLKAISFDAATIEADERIAAWTGMLAQFGAKMLGIAAPDDLVVRLSAVRAPWGLCLARLCISAQHLSLNAGSLPRADLALVRIVEGEGTLRTERGSLGYSAGDIFVGKMPRELRLAASGPTTVDLVHFGAMHSGSRLAALATPTVASPLDRDQGPTMFLGHLLELAVARFDRMTSDELRPLEITMIEFLMAAIATTSAADSVIEGSRGKNAIALRATQAIELRLSDPDLSPGGVAEHLGISLRYLQKLFEDAGENANHYIRRRRLERSHQDLADPLYQGLSIAEISYRWGFSDSAYFSRAFKDRYGMSPSQHRSKLRWGRPEPVKSPLPTAMPQRQAALRMAQ
jgi:AraC-like DNA-binding protein